MYLTNGLVGAGIRTPTTSPLYKYSWRWNRHSVGYPSPHLSPLFLVLCVCLDVLNVIMGVLLCLEFFYKGELHSLM